MDTQEDEDVIIQGSALHEHLLNTGYTDFEIIPFPKLAYKREYSSIFAILRNSLRCISQQFLNTYSWVMQEESISKNQLATILNAEVLLDDHASAIRTALDKYLNKPWRSKVKDLFLLPGLMMCTLYTSLNAQHRGPANFLTASFLSFSGYMKYSRACARDNVKSVVSLQNDLLRLCKNTLKILRYGYKIKINKDKSSQQFYDLTAARLKYLQPITENFVNSMEYMSGLYYRVSMILLKILPAHISRGDLCTRFEDESLIVHGEINYQVLKDLYYTFILTQSDMLHLLAIAYDTETWRQCGGIIPERKLSYITYYLYRCLTSCRNKLSENIDAYYSVNLETTMRKQKGAVPSKWQDLYVHLYLILNKLQLSYNNVSSILEDIDHLNEKENHSDEMETTMERLDNAYKDIDAAKNFVEFSSLLLAKTRLGTLSSNAIESNTTGFQINEKPSVVHDTEPQIIDEVFEEYIKEEYLKPLYEESEETSENYKWDKYLAKNFMNELKEALIDKRKSMSERESKALQRVYDKIIKDSDSKVSNSQVIPIPPSMPSYNICTTIRTENSKLSKSKVKDQPKEEVADNFRTEDSHPIISIPLPKIQHEMQGGQLGIRLPPNFLQSGEEMFIGSGENSEEESAESENENKE